MEPTPLKDLFDLAVAECEQNMREDYAAGRLIVISSWRYPEQAAMYQKLIHKRLTFEDMIEVMRESGEDNRMLDRLIKARLFKR